MAVVSRACALVLLAAVSAGAAAQSDSKQCAVLLVQAPTPQPALAALARRLQPACATVRPAAPVELAKLARDLRQQGHKRILLLGQGAGANAAMQFAGASGDAEGVIALGGDTADAGALPQLAAGIKQHVPLLWVVGSGDPLHARGEDYAYAKAPPHPASRYVGVKADAAGTPEAATRAVLEWIRALD
jgi:dienelactone hydrolase